MAYMHHNLGTVIPHSVTVPLLDAHSDSLLKSAFGIRLLARHVVA